MNWKQSLFKPRWQHKNPAIRSEAVAGSSDPELLQALLEIARNDESPEVRAAAAKRLDQPLPVIEAMDAERDQVVRTALQDRLRQLLTGPATEQAPVDDQVQAVKRIEDRTMLEAVAVSGVETRLRRAALEKLDRPGFLGDRAIGDPDPDLRRLAAERITRHATLKRVIDATRTTDKQLHHALIRRLHREQLAQGDVEAIRIEAIEICQQLEGLLRGGETPDQETIDALEARWRGLGSKAPRTLEERFQADLRRLISPAAENEQTAPPPTTVPAGDPDTPEPAELQSAEPENPEPDIRLQEAFASIQSCAGQDRPVGNKRLKSLADNWEAAWSSLERPAAADRQLESQARELLSDLQERDRRQQEQREQRLQAAREHLGNMQKALEDGELHAALEHRAALQKAGRQLKDSREWKQIQSSLTGALGRLRELRDWHHWANDKIRKRLIGEMESLPASGLHPDAVLDRIKALQAEWKSLETSEQIPGDRHYAAAPWMWRKFNAAGKHAFELTKPYLDKRSEVQSKHLETYRQAAQQLLALAQSDEVDWKMLGTGVSAARKALRSLSSVPAKQRQKLATELKKALNAANEVKQAHYAEIEKQKLKLIREAAQLQHIEARDEAIAQAKALQARWKSAGSLWRSRENALWKEFREPIEPLFAELENERESDRAEEIERRAAQEDLCRQMEELLGAADEELAALQGRVQGLQDAWRDQRRIDRKLKERFDRDLAVFKARELAHQQAAARQERARWWAKAELLHEAESARGNNKLTAARRKKLETAWQAAEAGDSDIEVQLEQRFRQALEGSVEHAGEAAEQAVDSARKICICLEFIAALPSPEDEKDLRMQYQVERLSASMTGDRERIPAHEEARQLEREWLLHDPVPDEVYADFRRRVRNALDKVLEE